MFSEILKVSKIIPIRKMQSEKDETDVDGWRPVNIIHGLQKVTEKVSAQTTDKSYG